MLGEGRKSDCIFIYLYQSEIWEIYCPLVGNQIFTVATLLTSAV